MRLAAEQTRYAGKNGAPLARKRLWLIAGFAIISLATFVRTYKLDIRPLHQDEAVNGFFLMRLLNTGVYQYDPANFHGPSLYYFGLISSSLFGLKTTAIRLVPAVFGVGTVLLTLMLRRRIGRLGALFAALLITVSPGAVYMSRYFIHESLFVFAALATVVAALWYYDSGKPLYLMLASVSFGLMGATKETAVISAVVLALALVLATLYMRMKQRLDMRRSLTRVTDPESVAGDDAIESWGAAFERLGGKSRVALSLIGGSGLFIIVLVLFFSSFLSNPRWTQDIFRSFQLWAHTGNSEHTHEAYMYAWWLTQEEAPVFALGLMGAGLAFWRARRRFPIFAALWACGLLAAYSLIPYKTPWLTLNFIVPLALLSGYAVSRFNEGATTKSRALRFAFAGFAVVIGLSQMIALNFVHFDDDRYPYVYAHTHRDFNRLTDDIARISHLTGPGESGAIAVTAPEYWPLPWYLRDYPGVAYYGKAITNREPIVVCAESQEEELQPMLGKSYERVDSYTLRPGVNLVLYALRRDGYDFHE